MKSIQLNLLLWIMMSMLAFMPVITFRSRDLFFFEMLLINSISDNSSESVFLIIFTLLSVQGHLAVKWFMRLHKLLVLPRAGHFDLTISCFRSQNLPSWMEGGSFCHTCCVKGFILFPFGRLTLEMFPSAPIAFIWSFVAFAPLHIWMQRSKLSFFLATASFLCSNH